MTMLDSAWALPAARFCVRHGTDLLSQVQGLRRCALEHSRPQVGGRNWGVAVGVLAWGPRWRCPADVPGSVASGMAARMGWHMLAAQLAAHSLAHIQICRASAGMPVCLQLVTADGSLTYTTRRRKT